jgi:phosphonopyruvate decarboxylase
MGRITQQMLDLMDIPWSLFPAVGPEIGPVLDKACAHMKRERRPYALVMRKGSVADTAPTSPGPDAVPTAFLHDSTPHKDGHVMARATRRQMLSAVQMALRPNDVVIASTGYAGRELYALDDRPCQFYMVGSMGCAMSLGLGVAVARPARRVIVIDGDGAALMRLGAFATLGAERPPNLLHLLLDNGMHESTGGQPTVSGNVDFPGLARAAGYPEAQAARDPEELREQVERRTPRLRFIHVPIRPGVSGSLPRPALQPVEVASRLRRFLE